MNKEETQKLYSLLRELFQKCEYTEATLLAASCAFENFTFHEVLNAVIAAADANEISHDVVPSPIKIRALVLNAKMPAFEKYDKFSDFGKLCWQRAVRNFPDYARTHQFSSPEEMSKSLQVLESQREKEFRRIYDEKIVQFRTLLARNKSQSDALRITFNIPTDTKVLSMPKIAPNRPAVGFLPTSVSHKYPNIKLSPTGFLELLRGWWKNDVFFEDIIAFASKKLDNLNELPLFQQNNHFDFFKSDEFFAEFKAQNNKKMTEEQRIQTLETVEKIKQRIAQTETNSRYSSAKSLAQKTN